MQRKRGNLVQFGITASVALVTGLIQSCLNSGQPGADTEILHALQVSGAVQAGISTLGSVFGNRLHDSINQLGKTKDIEKNHHLPNSLANAYRYALDYAVAAYITEENIPDNIIPSYYDFIDDLLGKLTSDCAFEEALKENRRLDPKQLLQAELDKIDTVHFGAFANVTGFMQYLSDHFYVPFKDAFLKELKKDEHTRTVYFNQMLEFLVMHTEHTPEHLRQLLTMAAELKVSLQQVIDNLNAALANAALPASGALDDMRAHIAAYGAQLDLIRQENREGHEGSRQRDEAAAARDSELKADIADLARETRNIAGEVIAGVEDKMKDSLRDLLGMAMENQAVCPGLLRGTSDTRLHPLQGEVFGRTEITEEIDSLLKKGRPAVVITGPGGIGKTEVCKAALKQWLEAHPGQPAWYISFPENSGALEAIGIIGRETGVVNAASFDELLPALKPGLYYLDNLESVAESKEGRTLLRQLKSCAGIQILTSSRLSVPELGKEHELQVLPLEAAVALFRHAWTGHDVLEDNAALRSFLQNELGCHALALVLVANLGQAYSLADIKKLWKERGIQLARYTEEDDNRLSSLDISLHLTSDVLQRQPDALLLWGLLALFPDGMPAGVKNVFVSENCVNEAAFLHLARHHVLQRTEDTYTILPTLARYAIDMAIAGTGGFSWPDIRDPYSRFIYSLAKEADHHDYNDEVIMAQQAIIHFLPTVYQFLQAEIRYSEPQTEFIGQLSVLLHNRYKDNITLSKEILILVRQCLDSDDIDNWLKATAEYSSGKIEGRLGNYTETKRFLEKALGLFEKIGNNYGIANTLEHLGDSERLYGTTKNARPYYERALVFRRKEPSNITGWANTLIELAQFESLQDNFEKAREHFEEAIPLLETSTDYLTKANLFRSLAYLEYFQDNLDEAERYCGQALTLYEKIHDTLGKANAQRVKGNINAKHKKYDTALIDLDEALHLYEMELDDIGIFYTNGERARCFYYLNQPSAMQIAATDAMNAAKRINTKDTYYYLKVLFQEIKLLPPDEPENPDTETEE